MISRAGRMRGNIMTLQPPVDRDVQNILLRDRYRSRVLDMINRLELMLGQKHKPGTKEGADLHRLVREMDTARDKLMAIEARLSNETSVETLQQPTDINFDELRHSIGGRLDRLRNARNSG